MSENQETVKTEEVKPVPAYRYVVSVRFKNSRKAYSFGTNDETLEYGDYVVVETVRGVEMGEIISNLRDVSMHTQNTPLKPVLRMTVRCTLKIKIWPRKRWPAVRKQWRGSSWI